MVVLRARMVAAKVFLKRAMTTPGALRLHVCGNFLRASNVHAGSLAERNINELNKHINDVLSLKR